MAIINNATANAAAATATTSKAAAAAAGFGNDFQSFLTLLTTQLKNQDPTEPLDTNQFTQQIATLSQVEQSISTNKNLEKLVSLAGGGQINQAVNYIGRNIDAIGSKGVLTNGQANFAYELPSAAASAKVTITNASGQIVFSGDGTTFAGKNLVTWDGVNSFNGVDEPGGAYTIAVAAKDAAGNALETKTYTTGKVYSVDLQNGNTVLSLGGGVTVKLDDVISVRQTPAGTTA